MRGRRLKPSCDLLEAASQHELKGKKFRRSSVHHVHDPSRGKKSAGGGTARLDVLTAALCVTSHLTISR